MNELDHLRTLRSQIPERTSEELALLTGWRPGGGEFRSARQPRVLPLALSGIALVAAAALLLALVVFPGSLTVGVGPAVDPSEEVTEEVEGDPMETMGPLIEKIGAQEQAGTVWYVRLERTEAMGVGPEDDLYTVLHRAPSESWRDTGAWRTVSRPLGNTWMLASEGHRDAWERDGSPERWTESVYGVVDIPQALPQELSDPVDSPYNGVNGMRFVRDDLEDLPTDPDGLRREFDLGTTVHLRGEPLDPYHEAVALPVPARVRAGIYGMVAQAPEAVAFEGEDVLGRPAVGVSQVYGGGTQGVFEHRLLFDPETAAPLSYEMVVVEPPAANSAWQRPGEHARYVAYEEIGWTDDWPL